MISILSKAATWSPEQPFGEAFSRVFSSRLCSAQLIWTAVVWKAHYLGGHRKRLAVPVASVNPFQSEIPDKEGEFTRVSFPLRCLRQVELNDMDLLARQIAG